MIKGNPKVLEMVLYNSLSKLTELMGKLEEDEWLELRVSKKAKPGAYSRVKNVRIDGSLFSKPEEDKPKKIQEITGLCNELIL